MIRSIPPVLILGWLTAFPAAAGDSIAASIVPLTVTLEHGRYRTAILDTLGGQVDSGLARGSLHGGAVRYRLGWSTDLSRIRPGWRTLGRGVLLTLKASIALTPRFELRKGAQHTYSRKGCEATSASVTFPVLLTAKENRLELEMQPAVVAFSKGYACSYQRNLLGSVVSLVKKEMAEEVDVVPLMTAGILERAAHLGNVFFDLLSGQIGGDSLKRRLNTLLAQPQQVSANVWLSGRIGETRFSQLTVSNNRLELQGQAQAWPRLAFGDTPPALEQGTAGTLPAENGFRLPFDLIIPRGAAGNDPAPPKMDRPAYRFRALALPGVAALVRTEADWSEDVVLVSGGWERPAQGRQPMDGPIDGVLAEILGWLETNPGVRGGSPVRLNRLLAEVRRAASVVAYFQRSRSIDLGAIGSLSLSQLSADLQWVSVSQEAIRAGVLLQGDARLNIAL